MPILKSLELCLVQQKNVKVDWYERKFLYSSKHIEYTSNEICENYAQSIKKSSMCD